MKILITGGTGFIGRALCKTLVRNGHDLTVLSRRPEKVAELCGESVKSIGSLDSLTSGDRFDAIINLAGEGIADARWTARRKQILRDSRIGITSRLVSYIETAEQKPGVLISGSAVGYYGDSGDAERFESSGFRDDFGHRLCAEWEETARKAETFGVRVCIVRTGLVIGENGGFLKRMLPVFKSGLGGRIGDGRQWMSWIHRRDYIRIIELLLATPELHGIFNATAPNPVTNAEFSATLARVLHRPAIFPVPAFVLRTLLGEMSELLLGGQKVLPERLQKEKFEFEFADVEQALIDVL
ncbi:MAG: TIGR01777 family oxidoreductase [Gammaproteobacteria bacterium]